MKKRNRSFEIFNLSFLDLISCGFGAVVLLILISRTSEDVASGTLEEAKNLIGQLSATEKSISDIEEEKRKQLEQIAKQAGAMKALQETSKGLTDALKKAAQENDKAKDDVEGLELVEQSLNRITITPTTNTAKRDDEVGGIPVDSDYVLFIVDTSGSMQAIWSRVSKEMQNVLSIHPKVKGFQILNDNGIHLISAYNGKWIPDTSNRRKNIFKAFRNWNSASNSSPVEGLRVALQKYANPNISLSIYILGDDYSGSNYNTVIDQLGRRNTNKSTGKPLAKIHAIGFSSPGATNRFGILMREVTKRNGGTFLALPR